MSTAKRERQRQNRQLRLEADQAAAKQRAVRRRIRLGGIAAVAAVVLIAGIWLLQRGGDDSETDEGQAITDSLPEPEANETPQEPDEPDLEELEDLPEPVSTAGEVTETAETEPPATEPGSETTTSETTVVNEPQAEGCPATDGSAPRTIDFDAPQPLCINPEASYVAIFDTSEGEMRYELTASETPLTVNNFVTLARWGYYDNTLLFRTDPSIDIIQGGSPHTNSASDQGPGYTIPDEPAFEVDPATGALTGPYRYQPGQLVMARSAGENSAGAQFFLTTGPNTALLDSQGTYVVFGNTDAAGLAVAQSIIGLHEPGGALGGAPSREVTVNSVTIEVS